MSKSQSGFTRFRVKYTNIERKADTEMAKKNNRAQKVERKDYKDLMKEMSDTRADKRTDTGHKNKKYNSRDQKREAPVVPEFATMICNMLSEQVCNYINFLNNVFDVDDPELARENIETKKDMERNLLMFDGGFHTEMEEESEDGQDVDKYDIYTLERRIQFNRETHSIIRCSMVAVMMLGGVPAYYVNARMDKNLIANIMVAPVTNKGTDFYNAAKWDNRPRKKIDRTKADADNVDAE